MQSAKLNGLDPWAYLRDVLARIHSPRAIVSMNCCRIAGGQVEGADVITQAVMVQADIDVSA